MSSFAGLARLGINRDNPFLFAKSIVARVSLKKKEKEKEKEKEGDNIIVK